MNVQSQSHEAVTKIPSLHAEDIAWTEICPGAFVKVLAVDEENNCIDTLTKFEPNFTFNRHRHLSQAVAYVIEGEIRDVVSGEVCGVGTWISNGPGTVHQEASGKDGFVLYASIRSDSSDLIEVLDEDDNVIQLVTTADYKAIFDKQ